VLIGCAACAVLILVLGTAPGGSLRPPKHLPELVPWRPSLSVRFTGQLTSMNVPVLSAGDRRGVVTVTLASEDGMHLGGIDQIASLAARRVAEHCRCEVRGYRVLARVPGRGVLVVASGGSAAST
jgi:hypothetical protein